MVSTEAFSRRKINTMKTNCISYTVFFFLPCLLYSGVPDENHWKTHLIVCDKMYLLKQLGVSGFRDMECFSQIYSLNKHGNRLHLFAPQE